MLLESMIEIDSLSVDLNIYCLWVGLVSSEIICVYNYLEKINFLLGMNVYVFYYYYINSKD